MNVDGMVRPMALVMALTLGVCAFGEDDAIDFNRDIRPILSDRCFHCHGPDEEERKGHLRLDTPDGEEGAFRTYKGSVAIKPKDLEASELWYRISTDDDEDVMPPSKSHKKALTAKEKQAFKQWILQGAEYPDFWAFTAPKLAAPSQVKRGFLSKKTRWRRSWSAGAIDDYVMGNLAKKQLRPQPDASKRTLIRRLTFDLTGLPPTLSEIDAFLKDDTDGAYAALVDRLLATAQYGEHMARYWADLVRLSDTNGMHKDFHRDFSTYRSWLIRAYNDNLPFDRFISDQLAGDLYDEPSQDQLIASGFNRLHLIIDVGTALPEESLHKNILDRVEAFGTAFLGLTVQCAQCHDHKYDPITQKEFYQLYAFFNNFAGKPETAHINRQKKRGFEAPFITLTSLELDQEIAELKVNKSLSKDKLKKQIDAIMKGAPAAMVMKESDKPRAAHILVRGAYDNPGEQVERNTPAFLPALKKKDGPYDRKDLADWLVDPAHPLTARVTVNRLWQQLFGVGLVKTSEDFGAQGEWPSHPDLLDYLAVNFVKSGWDVKALVREIVSSKTYRQGSDAPPAAFIADPENRQLARGARYRMDAEMIRDQMLAVSGKLDSTMYGASVKPPQPPGLWASVTMTNQRYKADKGNAIYRRSFYTYWKRAMPPPQMTILNAPSREFCVARRERTNTPLQALVLMNEPEYFKLARACAERILQEAGHDPKKALPRLYETLTSQQATRQRIALLEQALGEFTALYRNDPKLAAALAPDLAKAGSDRQIETAAWTMLTHSLLNLELTKVRR